MDPLAKVGLPAPDFSLPDLTGKKYQLSRQQGVIVVLNFWSAICPWAEVGDEILSEIEVFRSGDVRMWPIAVNANESVELLSEVADQRSLQLVLRDQGQRVADLFGAMATPHVFVIDSEGVLRYQGAIDDRTFRQRTPTKHYLEDALRDVLAKRSPKISETPAYGCAIVRQPPD